MKEGDTLPLPVQTLIGDILNDSGIVDTELFTLVFSDKDESARVEFLNEAFDLWLKDLLIVPLERAVFTKYPNIDNLLGFIKELGLSHDDAVDLMELLTINRHLTPFLKRLEDPLFNRFNHWRIEKTTRYTYITLEGDYRVRHFMEHVDNISIEEHLKTMGEV